MRLREVPPLPTWLLSQLVAGQRREALLGDLFEEYQAGRTAGWYWRETLVALLLSMRPDVSRLLSSRGARLVLTLIAQALLFAWLLTLSEQYRQHCFASPILLSDSVVPMLCAGAAQIAIALALWLSPLHRHVRINPRSGLVRLSVAVFAAIGLSGGALTWASTASCSMRPADCSSSSVVTACQRRGSESPQAQPPAAHSAHPGSRTGFH